ncbi:MAG: hypothetical protein IT200_11595 [Thermoleophilia bacterium]|nr:hypothetical protein [Thermoleophilia bacterium]
MGADPAAVHRGALEALRAAARGLAPGTPAAEVPGRIAAAAAGPEAAAMAVTYVYAARVGGAAADPEHAARWLRGWTAAARRSPAEGLTAVVDGIRFAERLHRTLGISSPG